jgi:hypothetical protein
MPGPTCGGRTATSDRTRSNKTSGCTPGNIKPYLGAMQLVKITPFQVQRWLTQLAEDGKRPASIKKAHTLLKTTLGVRGAIGDQRLTTNPCLEP